MAARDSVPTSYFQTYGMGWIVQDYRHYLVWQHGGNTPGMTTAVGMMPEKKFGVVVLSSMASAALPDLLRRYIFDREIGAPMKDLSDEAYKRAAQSAEARRFAGRRAGGRIS